MAETSKISWTDATWNFVVGCSHVSPGCENCYAESLALRWGWSKKPWKAQYAAENVILKPHRLNEPLKWKTPKRIFVNSLSDLFHEQVPTELMDQAFDVMERCPVHTFQILTKRPERMREYVHKSAIGHATPGHGTSFPLRALWWPRWIREHPHIWLGVSVEDQRRADERIPILLDTPTAVRFLSCEPLLGPVDITRHLATGGIHWVIVGGESGPRHRPMDPAWATALRDQCVAADVPFFYKQSSGPRPGTAPMLDGVCWEHYPSEITRFLPPPKPDRDIRLVESS